MPDEDNEEDKALWAYMMRDVETLPGREAKGPDRRETAPKKANRRKSEGEPRSVPAPPDRQNAEPAVRGTELDKRTQQRFERGKMAIEARLDLHGMNQGQARVALHDFIRRCHGQGLRKLLVITGKGRTKAADAAEHGVLRKNVPYWLGEAVVAPLVLRIQEARPEHGGAGALYVLLRRARY